MKKSKELVDIVCVLEHETEKAILINHDGTDKVWLPKSLIEYEKNEDGKTYTVTLPQSLAEDKGIV